MNLWSQYNITAFKLIFKFLKVFYSLWFRIKSLTCKPTLVKIVLNNINYVCGRIKSHDPTFGYIFRWIILGLFFTNLFQILDSRPARLHLSRKGIFVYEKKMNANLVVSARVMAVLKVSKFQEQIFLFSF